MKKLQNMEKLKNNAGVYAHIQGLNREGRENCDLPTDIHVTLKRNAIELPLNQGIYKAIQQGRAERQLLDIGKKNTNSKKIQSKTVDEALRQYSDEKVTTQILRGVSDWFCEIFNFIYIDGGALYVYVDDYFHRAERGKGTIKGIRAAKRQKRFGPKLKS